MKKQKFFIGDKIRLTRQEYGLTQKNFASELGISTSYLNQLENNQRHVTAGILLSLANKFNVDIKSIDGREEDLLLSELNEISKDEFSQLGQLTARELAQAVRHAPEFARAYAQLYKSSHTMKQTLVELDQAKSDIGILATPYDEVRDFYHSIDNYIDPLDRAGEELAKKIHIDGVSTNERLKRYIELNHDVLVKTGGSADYPNAIRRYDLSTRTLYLNPYLTSSSHAFQIACQIALWEQKDAIDKVLSGANFANDESFEVCKLGLANYFAGSVILPYEQFFETAQLLRHDIELMAHHFEASMEQVCHRLSTLQRSEKRGVPFFFARVDQAGNITKRHSATKLQFARFGSACPLWNVHHAFNSKSKIIRQLAQTNDGEKYLSIAFETQSSTGGFKDPVRKYALSIGCEVKYLDSIVYGDGLDISNEDNFDPIGISCRTCDRKKCHQRSIPPSQSALNIDLNYRNIVPYNL